jgi:hypothetical protein
MNDPIVDQVLEQFKTLFVKRQDRQAAQRALAEAWDQLYDIYRTWDMRHDLWQAAPAVTQNTAHLIKTLQDFQRLCQAMPQILDALPGGSIWNPAGDIFYPSVDELALVARQAKTLDEFLQLFLKRSA